MSGKDAIQGMAGRTSSEADHMPLGVTDDAWCLGRTDQDGGGAAHISKTQSIQEQGQSRDIATVSSPHSTGRSSPSSENGPELETLKSRRKRALISETSTQQEQQHVEAMKTFNKDFLDWTMTTNTHAAVPVTFEESPAMMGGVEPAISDTKNPLLGETDELQRPPHGAAECAPPAHGSAQPRSSLHPLRASGADGMGASQEQHTGLSLLASAGEIPEEVHQSGIPPPRVMKRVPRLIPSDPRIDMEEVPVQWEMAKPTETSPVEWDEGLQGTGATEANASSSP